MNRRELLHTAFAASAALPAVMKSRIAFANDDTQYIDTILESAAGSTAFIPQGAYSVDYIRPRSNTHVVIDPGSIFYRNFSPYPVLDLDNVDDVIVDANGSIFDGYQSAAQASHTVRMLGTRNVEIREPHIQGAHSSKDGCYIGLGSNECYRSGIKGGQIIDAQRNGASIVAGIRCFIEDMAIANVTGSPGAGVDVEANNHEYVNLENIIRGNDISNTRNAALVSFGDRTLIDGNHLHHNSLRGVYATSGGATRKVGVRRKHYDAMGVVGFDRQTGFIQISGDHSLVQPGTFVYLKVQNNAVLPGRLKAIMYEVTGVNTAGIQVNNKTYFTSEAVGSFDPDPDLSDFFLETFGKHGQSYGTRIINNNCHDNDKEDIRVNISAGVEVINNIGDVSYKYCEGIEING